jgi:tetratricopeptide (TPR) repeat protein
MRWFLVEFYLELGEVDAARSVLADAPDPVLPIRWLTVCLYERKVERAAELLRLPASDFRGFYDQDVPAYVIRDAAIARADLAGGREAFSSIWNGLVRPENDPFRLAALAQMSLAMGDRSEAERLARAALELRDWRTRSDTQYRLAYPRAAALTILGKNDAAMAVLEESFDRGYRKRWWYAFHRDPVFDPLRTDPRFRVLAEKADAHAAAELESLEHMRERGEVPKRSPSDTASADTC